MKGYWNTLEIRSVHSPTLTGVCDGVCTTLLVCGLRDCGPCFTVLSVCPDVVHGVCEDLTMSVSVSTGPEWDR